MNLKLGLPSKQLHEKFYSLQNPEDIAELLEISYKDLIYYLYRIPVEQRYEIFEIPKKSGGIRNISAPITSLKIVQHKLNQVLQSIYQPPPSVYGFISERSIVDNAHKHTEKRKKFVFNIDLKDFFPSINFGRVRGMFMAHPYNRPAQVATVLAQICCHDNALPQGAPTSPIISNMICAKMDTQLQRLAKSHKCIYTRYADDITFSTAMPNFPRAIGLLKTDLTGHQLEIGAELQEIIDGNGLEINPSKVRLQTTNRHQEVTGLTVNEFPNVPRQLISQARAMLHAWEIFGLENAEAEFLKKYNKKHRSPYNQENNPVSFQNVLRGKIEFIGMVRGKDDSIFGRFYYHYLRLLLKDETVGEPEVFISYSSKNRRFALRLEKSLSKQGVNVWMDVKNIFTGTKWRDEIQLGLNLCRIMILVITPDSMKSDQVSLEWQYFLDKHKLIIPILFKPTNEINYQLSSLQRIDFSDNKFALPFKKLCAELEAKGIKLKK